MASSGPVWVEISVSHTKAPQSIKSPYNWGGGNSLGHNIDSYRLTLDAFHDEFFGVKKLTTQNIERRVNSARGEKISFGRMPTEDETGSQFDVGLLFQ